MFQGKVTVEKHAQKTDAQQLCRGLLLSDQAEMDAKPELKIYADDVKCSHGAAIGALDADMLFYLRARGLNEDEARSLLVGAFVDDIIDQIQMPEWRDYLPCGRRSGAMNKIEPSSPVCYAPEDELFGCVAPRAYAVEQYRKDFPILDQQIHGHSLVYLDSAASAQKPKQVIEVMSRFMEHDYANVHRGVHELSIRATDQHEAARERVRRFLNAERAEEIIFVRNATEGINLVTSSWGRTFLKAGDEIVITTLEHHANIVPWQLLRDQIGIVLRVVPVTP